MIKNVVAKGTPSPIQRQTSSNQISRPAEKIKEEKLEKPQQGKLTIEKLKAEQERKNVKNILSDTLKARMQNFDHPEIPKMNDEQIENFAMKVENEMFIFFNKDTRDKYKTKYRSLKFNLGDVKNKTLIERICSNKLSPKQLVQLSSADLASEDLAKWREHEHKHQLEIITKSELESLAQTKVVLKSHKGEEGEEIIESESTELDIDPIQDVELIITKTILKVGDRSEGGTSMSGSVKSLDQESKNRSRRRSRSRSRDKERHHKSSHSKHRRSRSRSRSRNHKVSSADKSHDKSKRSNNHKRKRSRSQSRDKSKRHSEVSRGDHHHHHHHHHKTHEKHHNKHDKSEKHSDTSKISEIIPEKEDVDLVGKILDSMGVHVNLVERKEPHEEEKKESEYPPLIETAIETTTEKPKVEKAVKEVPILRGNLTTLKFWCSF